MKHLYLMLLLAALPLAGFAQQRVKAPSAVWPELQLSYGLGENGLLFVQNQYRINSDGRYNDLRPSGLFSHVERVELTLGYEHTFTEHWRGGGLFRYAIEDIPTTAFTAAFLRHTGQIKGLFFHKQVMVEYVNQERRDPFGRFRLLAELGKRLPLGSRYITPAVSYELFVVKEFGEQPADWDKRTIDRTRLRLELTYELTEKLRLTPYFMRQTDYRFLQVSPKYDENDVLLEEGYTTKSNRIFPVYGLEVKYSINKTPATASYAY